MHFFSADSVAQDADEAYNEEREILSPLVPSAQIEHIGSTAIPGSITKGDIDILVTVDAARFAEVDTVLARRYLRNEGSGRTSTFSAFETNSGRRLRLGVQLVARGSTDEWEFRTVQSRLAEPDVLAVYNAMKLRYEGRDEAEYRKAKNIFIGDILQEARARSKSSE